MEGLSEYGGYRALWAAILIQAVKDIDSELEAKEAKWWVFDSYREDIGSINWICSMLDIDVGKIQTLCLTQEGRWKILGPQHMNLVVNRAKARKTFAKTIAKRPPRKRKPRAKKQTKAD